MTELDEVERRQGRLAQLYTRDELPEDVLGVESQELVERRRLLESRRRELEPREPTGKPDYTMIEKQLPGSLAAIRASVDSADEDALGLLLRAVDAQITASGDCAEIRGSVPLIDQAPGSFSSIGQTLESGLRNGEIWVPFRAEVQVQ